MSTRSGKRIHSSFHENMLKPGLELVVNSERKTRSKRMKENIEESEIERVKVVKSKKRTNYVSYPSEEDSGNDTVDPKEEETKSTRMLRNTVMKDRNFVNPSETESVEVKKPLRVTRQTQKFIEDTTEETQQDINVMLTQKTKKGKKKKAPEAAEEEKVSKKKTKKKKKSRSSGAMIVEDIEPEAMKTNAHNISTDSFHSAAGSPIDKHVVKSPFIIRNSPDDAPEITTTFKPDNSDTDVIMRRRTRSVSKINNIIMPNTSNYVEKASRKRKSCIKLDKSGDEGDEHVSSSKKRKSKNTVSVEADTTCDNEKDMDDSEKRLISKDTTYEKSTEKINTTYDKNTSSSEAKTSIEGFTFDKNDDDNKLRKSSARSSLLRKSIINTTYEKSANNSCVDIASDVRKSEINTTFEKDFGPEAKEKEKPSVQNKNSTFDKVPTEILETIEGHFERKSSLILIHTASSQMNGTFDKKSDSTFDKTEKLDTTFENTVKKDTTFEKNKEDPNSTLDKDKSLCSTFDKIKTRNSTFDKVKISNSTFDKKSKSSLISSDNSNITLDKSDISRISITSDESKDNIVNTTPVLIESSMDESQINSSKLNQKSPEKAPITPLKREGTFTKESPEEAESVKCKTPSKRLSLPSPGYTPFPTKSGSKEKLEMNVTRSIEKSRRSSLAEPLPRLTKVMFCSPVNNPVVVTQQRRKVIKSNLKGSNKSFIMDDNARPGPRKRSLTAGEAGGGAGGGAAKRSRLDAARGRTLSAAAKLSEPGTPPRKGKPARTRLPNFAALHQRQFDKMESLDECQERKAKRARQLLTPTGSVSVLDRSSPKVSDTAPDTELKPQASDSNASKMDSKLSRSDSKPSKSDSKPSKSDSKPPNSESKSSKSSKEPKKPETPVKSLPTFKSLNPGYTRFGFKLNLDANPFSVPSKNDISRSEGNIFNFSTKKDSSIFKFSSKNNGLTRQVTAPSLTGTTSARREVAKQTVMREKSFTDKRVVKRHESRNVSRTIIKGVRTNRRFELQMKMRNID